jgi:hypothetical protein
MRLIFLSLIFLNIRFYAQSFKCKTQVDTADIIRIAQKKQAYWTGSAANRPLIVLNEESCEWIVISSRMGYTRKGNCKHTNGCSTVTTVTLFIDAQTKRVKKKNKEITLYPNYE